MLIKSVECIAKTEKLTREVLIREIVPEHKSSIYFKEKKKEVLSDLGSISSRYDLDERVVIYCFIRLWRTGLVNKFDFWESFNENRFDIIPKYLKEYYKNINEIQLKLWQE